LAAFLQLPKGRASLDVLKMAREELMLPLRAAINKAKKENASVRRENIRVTQNGQARNVHVEVIPLKNLKGRCFLILFECGEGREAGRAVAQPPALKPLPKREEARRTSALERELAETRDYLQTLQEQYEAANEELQASSEETQSTNEELQSVNEELETSKEELESSNEELITVNEEMGTRNTELSRVNADLRNLHVSINTAILLLGRDLTIRHFTPMAQKQFNLLATDVGRPLSGVRHRLAFPGLESFIAESISTVSPREQEVQDEAGNWYSLRVRPYLTVDNKIDGAVLVLVDISELKQKERKIQEARQFAQAIINEVPPLLILNSDLRVQSANKAFYRTFHVIAGETENCLLYDLGNGQWNIPALRMLLEEILPRQGLVENYEVAHEFERIGPRTMLLNARQIEAMQMILLSIVDITERKKTELALQQVRAELENTVKERTVSLRETVQELEAFSYSMVHDMRAPLRAMNTFAHLVHENYSRQLDEQGREYLARIFSSAERLDQLIRDVLNYSRTLRDQAPLSPVNLDELMPELLATYPDWRAGQSELNIEGPLGVVLGHKALLAQCFSNLIGNALKFVAPEVRPRVRIWAESRDHRVRINIQDNGIGIAAEHRQRVFGMFQRINPASEYVGTGIGLAIVRRAVERMHGQVGFQSEVRTGSTFWFELPKGDDQ
jgi:two-component system CheB/CheR fusion protein